MASFAQNIESQFSAALSTPAAPAAASPEPAATPSPAPANEPAASPAAPSVVAPSAATPPSVGDAPKVEATPVAEPPAEDDGEFKFPDEVEKPKVPDTALDDEDISGGALTKEQVHAAETALLATARGRQMLASFKRDRELTKDLGFVPDAAQVKEFHANAQRYQAATSDFFAAQPETAQRWLENWLVPTGDKPTPAALQVATQLMPLLAKHADSSPAAAALYQAAAVPAVHNWINELYEYAKTMPTREERIQWLNVARFSEARFSGGEFREIPNELVETGADPNAPDPRVVEIDQKLANIKTYEEKQAQEREQWFRGNVTQQVSAALTTDIDAALSRIKEQFPATVYEAIAERFHKEVARATRENPANLRSYFEARDVARANPTAENFEKAGKAWAVAARPAIRNLRTQYINDALGQKAAESADRHKTLEEASQKRGAPSVAAPVAKSIVDGSDGPQKGESHAEFRQRQFSKLLSQSA